MRLEAHPAYARSNCARARVSTAPTYVYAHTHFGTQKENELLCLATFTNVSLLGCFVMYWFGLKIAELWAMQLRCAGVCT